MTEVALHIETAPRSGGWNMALDEALLESALLGGQAFVRWYTWSEPTLSLGYFQPVEELQNLPRWQSLTAVRRLSGGGAILHHHEWTYACVLPAEHPLTKDFYQIYILVHRALITVLNRWGYSVQLRSESGAGKPPNQEFLCFHRGDGMDIVLGNDKIVGSAQRRRKGAVLQHGSIVLQRSPFAPEFPGLFDFQPCSEPATLQKEMSQALAEVFGRVQSLSELPPALLKEAETLYRQRYSSLAWGRKNPLSPT